jgi:competence protein ComEC
MMQFFFVMRRSLYVRTGLISFLAGIAAGAFVVHGIFLLMCIGFLLAGFAGWKVLHGIRRIILVVGLAAFLAGTGRFLVSVPVFGPADIAFYRDTNVMLTVEGMVGAEPDVRPDFIYLVLGAEKIYYSQSVITVRGNLLLKLQRYPQYVYGDRLKVSGRVVSPPVLEGFSYADRLAKDGIYAVMYRPAVAVLKRGILPDGWDAVFGLKSFISARINEVFSEPAASLTAGVLLGLRRSIPADVNDSFNRTGLTHILAISGYNITLLISVFGMFLKQAVRRTRFWGSLGGIMVFVLLTGMSASVIRAAVMGGLVLLSLFCGRKSSGVQALIVSAALMSLVNPRILLFDMSFQLSFLATLGILLFMPVIEERVVFLKKLPAWMGEGLGVTLAAQVFTTPLILYSFGRVSLISPLTNIVFLPLIPFIMFFSFFAIVSSLLWLPVTALLAGITWVLCMVLVCGVGAAADLPLASLDIKNFPLWAMLGSFGLAAAARIILSRKPRSGRCF